MIHYTNFALGKQMDLENVSDEFIEDLNRLLQATVYSIQVHCTQDPLISNMEFKKGIEGLELSGKVDSRYVKKETLNERTN